MLWRHLRVPGRCSKSGRDGPPVPGEVSRSRRTTCTAPSPPASRPTPRYVPREAGADRGEERLHVASRSLRQQFHPAVGQVADGAGHAIPAGDGFRRDPEPDPLDPAGVVDQHSNYFRHSVTVQRTNTFPHPRSSRIPGPASSRRATGQPHRPHVVQPPQPVVELRHGQPRPLLADRVEQLAAAGSRRPPRPPCGGPGTPAPPPPTAPPAPPGPPPPARPPPPAAAPPRPARPGRRAASASRPRRFSNFSATAAISSRAALHPRGDAGPGRADHLAQFAQHRLRRVVVVDERHRPSASPAPTR